MLKTLLISFCTVGLMCSLEAQNPNQNPNYQQSRAHYQSKADSINAQQGTTHQQTYKAIDYLADKADEKALRRQNRHELRMERARWGYSNWNVGWYPSIGLGYGWGWHRPYGYYRF